jgi:hypothetical protein
LLDAEIFLSSWRSPGTVTKKVMEGGWTRYYNFILTAQ